MTSNISKIYGILGGSFDPPHRSHLSIAIDVLRKKLVQSVTFLPTGQKAAFKECTSSAKDRIEMTRKLIQDASPEFQDLLELNSLETFSNTTTYTYDTLLKLKNLHKDAEFAFILGADQCALWEKWNHFPEVLTLCHWIIVPRKNYETANVQHLVAQNLIEEVPAFNHTLKSYKIRNSNYFIHCTDTIADDISSSAIRNKFSKHTPHLTPNVLAYIQDKGLYHDSI